MPINFLRNCFAIEDEPSYPHALHAVEEPTVMSSAGQISVALSTHDHEERVATSSSSRPLPGEELKLSIASTNAESSEDESASATGSDTSSLNMNMAADADVDADTHPPLNLFILVKQFFDNLEANHSHRRRSSHNNRNYHHDEKDDDDDDEDNGEESYEDELMRHQNALHSQSENSKSNCVCISPLRTATNYSSCTDIDDIPTIALEEVVMPGSKLQKSMSLTLKNNGILSESTVDECVICLEAFDEDNPRMPTMCACGENKTFFHLPCLYMYMSRTNKKECPTCRQPLTWEEF